MFSARRCYRRCAMPAHLQALSSASCSSNSAEFCHGFTALARKHLHPASRQDPARAPGTAQRYRMGGCMGTAAACFQPRSTPRRCPERPGHLSLRHATRLYPTQRSSCSTARARRLQHAEGTGTKHPQRRSLTLCVARGSPAQQPTLPGQHSPTTLHHLAHSSLLQGSAGIVLPACRVYGSPRRPFQLSLDAIHEMKQVTTKVISSCHPRSLPACGLPEGGRGWLLVTRGTAQTIPAI